MHGIIKFITCMIQYDYSRTKPKIAENLKDMLKCTESIKKAGMSRKDKINWCVTCEINFENQTLLRSHYHSDLHIYNSRLKISNLFPLSQAEFDQKTTEEPEKTEEGVYCCRPCKKYYQSVNSLNSHKNSRQCKKLTQDASQKSLTQKTKISETQDSENTRKLTEIPENVDFHKNSNKLKFECYFCTKSYDLSDTRFSHMENAHSFFIPYKCYLKSESVFLKKLEDNILKKMYCMGCGSYSKVFDDLFSLKSHMRDKNHCFINLEDLFTKYKKFFSFPTKLVVDGTMGLVPGSDSAPIDTETFDLVLPNGNRLGHRDLKIYFNQNLKDRVDYGENMLEHAQYDSGSNGVLAIQQLKVDHLSKNIQIYEKKRCESRIYMAANKNQTHFRSQNPK